MGEKSRKYVLTDETMKHLCYTLHRIKAVRSFGNVQEGKLGGWVESEENLSQEGNCWVYGNAQVYGNAWVYGDARVYGDAWVYGNAQVYGDAQVDGNAQVYGNAWVYGNARVHGDAQVDGNAQVSSNAWVYGDARVYGNAQVYGDARVSSNNDHCGFDCFGSANRHTHAYRTENGGIELTCGCFCGSLDEFARRVEATHAGTIYEKQYKHIIGVMKIKFGIEANEEDGTEYRV